MAEKYVDLFKIHCRMAAQERSVNGDNIVVFNLLFIQCKKKGKQKEKMLYCKLHKAGFFLGLKKKNFRSCHV